MSALFEECLSHKMLNVLALKTNEVNSKMDQIYSYTAFPHFQMVQKRLSDVRIYFEPQIKNLYGYNIIVFPDNVLPRAVIHTDAQGHRQVTGYLSNILENFAKNLNASLSFCCLMQTEIIPDETISKLLENGSVHLAASVQSPSFVLFEIRNTNTIEISKCDECVVAYVDDETGQTSTSSISSIR
ncbi:uncharacterized protein Dwil_GK27341 [Drosophila willistoni]|uniref:Uncharacterized protein n=1 Tax=Drosophila willistoni TaxID=7260 RepID=A0A0Q9WPH2_DROWI|nr:uncharacterized protein Dwil_GK27341 [Drosophila willistoni]